MENIQYHTEHHKTKLRKSLLSQRSLMETTQQKCSIQVRLHLFSLHVRRQINWRMGACTLLPKPGCRYGYMCAPGPRLGTSSYWKAVILRLMSVWGTASTKRAPSARLKQCTVPWAWSSSASSSARSPARSRYTWEPWTRRTHISSIHLIHHTAEVIFWLLNLQMNTTLAFYCDSRYTEAVVTLPGSKCGVWCTHGDLPRVLMRVLCLAAGWQWWPPWGRATPETPESSVGRPAPHLCDETRGSNHCRWEDTFSFHIFHTRHVVHSLIQSER